MKRLLQGSLFQFHLLTGIQLDLCVFYHLLIIFVHSDNNNFLLNEIHTFYSLWFVPINSCKSW